MTCDSKERVTPQTAKEKLFGWVSVRKNQQGGMPKGYKPQHFCSMQCFCNEELLCMAANGFKSLGMLEIEIGSLVF
jgi:hypothetical protein